MNNNENGDIKPLLNKSSHFKWSLLPFFSLSPLYRVVLGVPVVKMKLGVSCARNGRCSMWGDMILA